MALARGGNAHRGQRRVDIARGQSIVAAGDRQVFGDAQAPRPAGGVHFERDRIVEGDDGRGAVGPVEQGLDGAPPLVRVVGRLLELDDQRWIERQAGASKCLFEPLAAHPGRVIKGRRQIQQRDAAVTQVQQVARRLGDRADVVEQNRRRAQPFGAVVAHYQRDRALGELEHVLRGGTGRNVQDAVDCRLLGDLFDVRLLALGVAARAAHQQRVIRGDGGIFDGLDHLVDDRLGNSGDHDGDGARLVGAEAAGGEVEPVIQLLDRRQHARSRVVADQLGGIQGAGYGRGGYPRQPGDIFHFGGHSVGLAQATERKMTGIVIDYIKHQASVFVKRLGPGARARRAGGSAAFEDALAPFLFFLAIFVVEDALANAQAGRCHFQQLVFRQELDAVVQAEHARGIQA